MNRICSLALCLSSLTLLAAEKPRTDLYGDPLPPGAVMRFGTIRLHHAKAVVVFSKDGKQLISCDREGAIRFWDTATGKLMRQHRLAWKKSEENRFPICSLSSEETIAATWDEALHLHDVNTGKVRAKIAALGNKHYSSNAIFSPQGDLLFLQSSDSHEDITAAIWDIKFSKKHQTLTMHPKVKLATAAFSWDGRHLAGIAEKQGISDLFLWETTSGKLLRARKGLQRIDDGKLAFSPDGKTLAVGGRGEAAIRFLAADTLVEKTKLTAPVGLGPTDFLNGPTFSPDGRKLAAVYGTFKGGPEGIQYWIPRGVLLWDLSQAKEPRRLTMRGGFPLAFAPDSKTLACGRESAIYLFDVSSGNLLHDRPGHEQGELALTTSPDGKLLASGGDNGVVRLWDTATSKQRMKLEGRDLYITDCLFSSDGQRIAAGNLGGFTVDFQAWETANGKKLGRLSLRDEEGCLYAAGISADSRYLMGVYAKVANEPPGNLISWHLASGKQVRQKPYRHSIHKDDNGTRYGFPAAFSPDGEQMSVWLGDRLGIAGVATGCFLAKLPKEANLPLLFSPDGRLVVAMIRPSKEDGPDFEGVEIRSLIESASGQEIVRLELKAPNKIAFTPDDRGLIVSDHKNLYVWDTVTGEKLHQMAWPDSILRSKDYGGYLYVPTVAVLPGSRVAASMPEGDIVVWDLQPSTWPNRTPKHLLDRKELESLWCDLGGEARKAYRAFAPLITAPSQTVAFFQDKLRPAAEDKRIAQFLADLESDSFTAREEATRELKRLYARAEPVLRKALESKPSLEMRRRIEEILIEPKWTSPPSLRTLRAIAVLERIGTAEARRLLEKLADGAPAPETQAAQRALRRMTKR